MTSPICATGTCSQPSRLARGLLIWALALPVGSLGAAGDWPHYGGDAGATKYSALDQIDARNVGDLTVAWRWRSADRELVQRNPAITPWGFKSTPIMVNGVLYISTSLNQVAAIDAASGAQRWVFDPGAWRPGRPTNLGFNHRGVAYWRDGDDARILMGTNDARLWSLDATTGRPDPRFGRDGSVDLKQGLGRTVTEHYSVISPPVIVGDVAVLGSSIFDGPSHKEMPPGHVRGFDVRSGAQRWIFHTIPQNGEAGADSWEHGAWRYSGNTNVWTMMSADPELGYVYLPVGTPTNDWYGGHRLGDNRFAESLVCLDAKTGKRVWDYQIVHHGLWDYDLPAAPILADIEVDGRPVPAVVQLTKQAFVFVFDRRTGEPVWPIEERPVPASDVPGERAAPTQPFPSRPPAIAPQGFDHSRLVDFTPELREQARRLVAGYRLGPLYTPPSLEGTVQLPGWGGGANWSGGAFDPDSHLLYVPARNSPIVVKLTQPDPDGSDFRYVRSMGVTSLAGPAGLPIVKPPYATVTAVDLDAGSLRWQIPHGDGPRRQVMALGIADPGPLGSRRGGTGPLVTKTLLFVGQTDGQRPLLRAFDKATGAIVHELALPDAPWGTPMTYAVNGRQYIALALGQGADASLVALSLPETSQAARHDQP